MEIEGAPATYALIIANVIASVYGFVGNSKFVDEFSFRVGALIRDKQHYRVFTSSFLHGDLFHLLFNMMTLLFFGPTVERILGTDGFLAVYFGAILTSGIVSFYVNRKNLAYASLGASDAVSGIVLAFCMFFPMAPIYIMFVPVGIPAILYGALFILISARLMGRAGNRIAHEGHLGGAIAGVVLTLLLEPGILGGEDFYCRLAPEGCAVELPYIDDAV